MSKENIFEIVGLKVIPYAGQIVVGGNCDFEYVDAELVKYIVCLTDDDGILRELCMYVRHGECYSGWTTATFGMAKFKTVDRYDDITHTPKKGISNKIEMSLNLDAIEEYLCPWFSFSWTDGDRYYPSGYVNVNMDMFDKISG